MTPPKNGNKILGGLVILGGLGTLATTFIPGLSGLSGLFTKA